MPVVAWELLIIFCLILANGFFAGAEIAIIAARRWRLKQMADEGDRAARIALELAENPHRFLPTVQIGITLVATFAAAFGGARLVEHLAAQFAALPIPIVARHAQGLALVLFVMSISFASVLIGELIPKHLALLHATRFARWAALPLDSLANFGRPIVWLMGLCTNVVLTGLGSRRDVEPEVSFEDIEHMIRTGTSSGVLGPEEQELVLEALHLRNRTVRDILCPRLELDALEVDMPAAEIFGAAAMSCYSRLPVYQENLDQIIGYIHVKDVMHWHFLGVELGLRKLLHPALFVPETLSLDRLLRSYREQGTQFAVALDEFGGTEGIVTLQDVFDELIGEFPDERQPGREPEFIARDEVSWLVEGTMNWDDVQERIGVKPQQSASPRPYSTLAGLVLSELGKIPRVGDRLKWGSLNLEVVEMAGQRIDRVLVTRCDAAGDEEDQISPGAAS